jgi:AraC-like DNA-binding protein
MDIRDCIARPTTEPAGMPWSRVVTFTDPLACEAALQSTVRAEIIPVGRGRFHTEATQIGMDKLRMQRFKVALPQISTVEASPDRKSIGFLLEASSPSLQHCGLKVAPNDIIIYGHGLLHQRSEADFQYGTLSVPAQDFPVLFATIIGQEFREWPRTFIVRPDPALMSRLLKLHKVIGQLAHDTPDVLLDMPEVRRALEEQLIHVIVRCIAEGAGVEATVGDRRHGAIMARFEEFLETHPDQPLYLTEICAALRVAERTLRIICEERFGMGPVRFLTLRRMHLVRRALLCADSSKTTVTGVVTDHGFWELGRFSVAYRTLFGESPSETLRRPAEQIAIDLNRPLSLPGAELMGRAKLTAALR